MDRRFLFSRFDAGRAVRLSGQLVLAMLLLAGTCRGQSYEGFLEPNHKVNLTSAFRGILEKLYVREGDRVKPGVLVAELDSRVLRTELKSAKKVMMFHGKIDSARALLDLRQKRLQSLEALMKSGNARNREVERARTDVAMARSGLQMALEEKQVHQLEYEGIAARLEERKIRSPINGVVVRIFKQQAELIGALQGDPLMTIVQLDPLKAVFHLPPAKAAGFKPGQQVSLKLTGHQERLSGIVDFVSPIIEPDSGTVRVNVRVPNQGGRVQSGARCTLGTDE